MGGKLSSPSSPSRPQSSTIAEHTSTPSGIHNIGVGSRGDGSVAVTSVGRNHGRQVLHFDPGLFSESHASQLGVRVTRAQSTADAGLRIPHSEFSWLYSSSSSNGSDRSSETRAGSSRVVPRLSSHPNLSRSLPPYFLSHMRGILSSCLQ